jgi:hypothetical protein
VIISYTIIRFPLNEENVGGIYFTFYSIVNPIRIIKIKKEIKLSDSSIVRGLLPKLYFIKEFDKDNFRIIDVYCKNGYTLVFVELGKSRSRAVYFFKANRIERIFL